MKEPIRFIREDGESDEVLFCCGECGSFCGMDEIVARYHCGERPCDICGQLCQAPYRNCEKCRAEIRIAQREEQIAKAEKVSVNDYDGPVFWDQEDKYYPDIGEAWEAITDDIDSVVEAKLQTLWACDAFHLTLSPSDILDQAFESQEHHEDARDWLSEKAYEELKHFCDAWNDAHGAEVETWFPNDKIVVIPQEWLDKFEKEVTESNVDGERQDG